MGDRHVCTADDPWTPQKSERAEHPDAYEVGDQESGWPGGDVVHLMHGPGPRGFGHVVVGRGGEMVHDPHPSRAGLLSVEAYTVFVRVGTAAAQAADAAGRTT